jgi:hypothetical protein
LIICHICVNRCREHQGEKMTALERSSIDGDL